MNLRERICSLEKLRHECPDAERMLAPRWSRQSAEGEKERGFSYRPRMEELEDQQEDEDGWPEEGEVEALHRQEKSRDKSALNCWNCNDREHIFWECESTVCNIFCYKCGRECHRNATEKVVLPKCPKCQSGNWGRSMSRAEEPRSNPFATW
ncbi:uncharacterized protein [Drosophila bipectinata]|uniref:uncharacterized protein n=1 Tax=Drosophila bipectinata TaxID=42026 RepID=UPI0038B398E3